MTCGIYCSPAASPTARRAAHVRRRAARARGISGTHGSGDFVYPHRMSVLMRLYPILLCWVLCIGQALAQDPPAGGPTLEEARAKLGAIDAGLAEEQEEAALVEARDAVLAIQAQAERFVAENTPRLERLDARLAELGPAPEAPRTEPPEVTRERRALAAERNDVDSDLRLARLMAVESTQTLDHISALRQARFRAELWERTAPALSSRFWSNLRDSAGRDGSRLRRFGDEAWQSIRGTVAPHPWRLLLLLAFAGALGTGAWWINRRWLPRLATTRLPAGRIRRSLPALAKVLVASLSAWWIAALLGHGLVADEAAPERLRALAGVAIGLAAFTVYVIVLGRVLLARGRSSWRLPGLTDDAVAALHPLPLAGALVIACNTLLERAALILNASLALSVAVSTVTALLSALVILLALLRLHAARRNAAAQAPEAPARLAEVGLNLAMAAGWIGFGLCTAALLTGFVAFANFVGKQLLWASIVVPSTYLLICAADDLIGATLTSKGRAGQRLTQRFGMDALRIDRIAVVLSGVLRVGFVALALIALIAPYGASGDDLINRALGLARGVTLGELVLSPGVILRAAAVFVLAYWLFRVLQRWFGRRYLPTTRMDEGMRASVVSLLGYVGFVLALAMALAAIGVSLERIAWIASALSVGIGFGLQAIVQNFISGLILLAERPVKVGDWVIVGDAEGDIRKINVRATEIQTGDRTTVLVPNSELITKIVRNRTYSNAEGLVKVLLPMPLSTDVALAQRLILEILREHPGILDAPAPSVDIDGIVGDRVVLNVTGYVASPRLAYAARSAVLFEILQRMRELGIKMA